MGRLNTTLQALLEGMGNNLDLQVCLSFHWVIEPRHAVGSVTAVRDLLQYRQVELSFTPMVFSPPITA